jgi:protein TonB
VVFLLNNKKSMKSLWGSISLMKPLTFLLSVSIHMVIFSIPIKTMIKPQTHEIELFIFMKDIRVPTQPVKTQKEMKKPQPQAQPEPVKEIIKPIEPSSFNIQKPEMIEPIKEVTREPMEEVKVEQIEVKSNSPPTTESNEAPLVSPVANLKEENTDISDKERSPEALISMVEQPRQIENDTGGEARSFIETKFGASVAPAFLHREMPVYPMMARRLGREGKVMLKVTIDEEGNLLDVKVIDKAGYGFTEAAVEAVKKSTFLPAKKDGKRIASRAFLPIRFQLERN